MTHRDDKDVKTSANVATEANADPLTGASGAHPIGTGLGAAGGGLAGAAVGALGGPIGAVIGATVGAVAGGLAGKGVAEVVDPTAEEAYWRKNYKSQSHVSTSGNLDYNDYGPAYRLGWESRSRLAGKQFDEIENDLAASWDKSKDKSRLTWDNAKAATKAAWQHASDGLERATPGDSDRDGK